MTTSEIVKLKVLMYRKKNSLDQKVFAKLVGVTQGTISKIESSNMSPGLDIVDKLATAMGTTVSKLVLPTKGVLHERDEEAKRVAARELKRNLPGGYSRTLSRS